MNPLEVREREIFETIKSLKNCNFIIIGGYAVNVYTLPRFSVDCDIVLKGSEELKICKILEKIGYKRENDNKIKTPYHGEFIRYEKELEKGFKVSADLLINNVMDRQTGANITADWIFDNSSKKLLKGKTFQEKIKAKIPNVEALIVMKLLSCRNTDIRDVFMMLSQVKDFSFIKREVSERADLNKQLSKLKEKINSKNFKDNLQGVFGFVPELTFAKYKELIIKLEK